MKHDTMTVSFSGALGVINRGHKYLQSGTASPDQAEGVRMDMENALSAIEIIHGPVVCKIENSTGNVTVFVKATEERVR